MSRRYIVALVVAFLTAAAGASFWFARHEAVVDGEFAELDETKPAA